MTPSSRSRPSTDSSPNWRKPRFTKLNRLREVVEKIARLELERTQHQLQRFTNANSHLGK